MLGWNIFIYTRQILHPERDGLRRSLPLASAAPRRTLRRVS